mmetsp:Transcript_4836/g.11901  ORF Transcript_4836/g.11901 Transcript_4836/m.11901 type:complete len:252 (-) Transcript_4836:240-995(-)
MGVVQRKLGRCCVCLPLSHGVAALCILFFFLGLYDFLVLFLDDVRLQFNGAYFRTALYQKVEPFFATFYAPFGLLGFVGVMDEKASYVHGFWAFMTFHLFIVYVGVFVCDFYSLYMNCGSTTDANVQDVSPAERNQSLEALRGKGLCSDAQIAYGIGFGIMLAVRLYWWSVLRKYVQKLSTAVPYPIAFDQNQYIEGVEVDFPDNVGDYHTKEREESYERNVLADMERKDLEYATKMLKEYGTVKSEKYNT